MAFNNVTAGSVPVMYGTEDTTTLASFLAKINGAHGTGAAAADLFGWDVAVGSGRIVIGASSDDDNALSNSGSAYIFDLDGNFINKINGAHGTGAGVDDYFGTSVAVGSGRVVVGAYLDDDNGLSESGSAYIFTIPNVVTVYDHKDRQYG